MNNLEILQERTGDALARLTELNDTAYGFGGAAGDIDREQYEALLNIAWALEKIIENIGG